jgi:hypothetical protein
MVVAEIAARLEVTLRPVGRRQKYFCDHLGRHYWIVGGSGYWHGIPDAMMDAEASLSGTKFFIAVRKTTKIDIFVGSARDLYTVRSQLSKTQTGNYEFTIEEHHSVLHVKNIPHVQFQHFSAIEFSLEKKETQRSSFVAQREIEKSFDKLSPGDRKRLIEKLKRS